MRRHRVCIRAFPAAWRQQYERELLRLLAEAPERRWQSVDLLRAGLRERVHRLAGTRASGGWLGVGMKISFSTAIALLVGVVSLGGGGLGSGTAVDLLAGRGSVLAARARPSKTAPRVVFLNGRDNGADQRSLKLALEAQARVASRQVWVRSARPDLLSTAPKGDVDAEMPAVALPPANASTEAPIAVTTSGTPLVASSAAS